MWYGEQAINGDVSDHWSYGRELKQLVCSIMLAVRAVVWNLNRHTTSYPECQKQWKVRQIPHEMRNQRRGNA